jgi:hypothetical protein
MAYAVAAIQAALALSVAAAAAFVVGLVGCALAVAARGPAWLRAKEIVNQIRARLKEAR